MNRDYDDDDDDDDLADVADDDDFEDGVLKDGRKVTVPISFMDAANMEALKQKYPPHRGTAAAPDVAAHKPGFRVPGSVTDNDVRVGQAYAGYIRYLQDAHRQRPETSGHPDAADAKLKPKRPLSLADAQAAAEQARLERDAWLVSAHKERPRRRRWGWEFGDGVHD